METGIGGKQRLITIPQQCVNRVQGIESVWVVRVDSTVVYRQISTTETLGSRWVIQSGLSEGERVAVTGSQKLHNGAKIIPQNIE